MNNQLRLHGFWSEASESLIRLHSNCFVSVICFESYRRFQVYAKIVRRQKLAGFSQSVRRSRSPTKSIISPPLLQKRLRISADAVETIGQRLENPDVPDARAGGVENRAGFWDPDGIGLQRVGCFEAE
jgi:hypothetical protein